MAAMTAPTTLSTPHPNPQGDKIMKFTTYLNRQRKRDDRVGDLARDWRRDPNSVFRSDAKVADVRDVLYMHQVRDGAHLALCDAEFEWNAKTIWNAMFKKKTSPFRELFQ